MNPSLNEFKDQTQKTVTHLSEDLKSIRTGRANPSMIEGLTVETYGGQTKLRLMELSTIVNEDSFTLIVSAYDPSTIQDIEKAILKSPIGLTPKVQGTKILVRIPPLNEEQRTKLAKLVGQKVEEKKSIVRNLRDDARRKIKQDFEAKNITEDQKYKFEKDIDNLTQEIMTSIQTLKDNKERQIMEV